MAKAKQKQENRQIKLPSGNTVGVDRRGNIVTNNAGQFGDDDQGGKEILVTAKELDQIVGDRAKQAARTARREELKGQLEKVYSQITTLEDQAGKLETEDSDLENAIYEGRDLLVTTDSGIDIEHDAAQVAFGCQKVPLKLLKAGHAVSLSMRKRKK